MRPRPLKPETSLSLRERRAHLRVPVRASVTVEGADRTLCGWVRNLSCGGMFVETDAPLSVNTEVRVHVLLREGYSVRRLDTAAWIAWVSPDGMGLQFDTLPTEDVEMILRTVERFL